jgi:hypothetical protein
MNHPVIPFITGKPFTLVGVSSTMANTTLEEVIVSSVLPEPVFLPAYAHATHGTWRYGTYKLKGKRKEFHLDVPSERTLVFSGHGVVMRDWDLPRVREPGRHCTVTTFAGNACINLGGTAVGIRTLIETRNLNPGFSGYDCVMAIPPVGDSYAMDTFIPVFPEVPSHHAVVQRYRAAAPAAACDPANGGAPPAPAESLDIPVRRRCSPERIAQLAAAFA